MDVILQLQTGMGAGELGIRLKEGIGQKFFGSVGRLVGILPDCAEQIV